MSDFEPMVVDMSASEEVHRVQMTLEEDGGTIPMSVASSISVSGDYERLTNKPSINGVELVGDLDSSDLGLQSALEFDDYPAEDSENPVTSGGVYAALFDVAANVVASTSFAPGLTNPQEAHIVNEDGAISAGTLKTTGNLQNRYTRAVGLHAEGAEISIETEFTHNSEVLSHNSTVLNDGLITTDNIVRIKNPDVDYKYLELHGGTSVVDPAISGLGAPSGDSYAANKKYVDDGLALKADKSEIPTVPTKVSDLTNDSGFITGSQVPSNEQDPTVPAWAKASSKPTYTAAEVGALPATSDAEFSGNVITLQAPAGQPSPILRFQRGALTDNYNDWQIQDRGGFLYFDQRGSGSTAWSEMVHIDTTGNMYATGFKGYLDWSYVTNKPTIPTATSQLTNDSGFVDAAGAAAAAPVQSVNGRTGDVTGLQEELTFDTTPTASSTNPVTSDGIKTALDGKQEAGSYAISDPADTTHAAKRAAAIFFGQVDSTSTATAFTATIPGITEYYDGLTVMLKNGVVTSASGFTININGLGAKQSYTNLAAATADTTLFNESYTMLFVYDSTRVANGGWICYRGYDANTNTIGYQLRTNSTTMPMKSVTYRYRLLFTSADGQGYVPANNSSSTNATASRTVCQDKIDPHGQIFYYGTTASVAAGSRPSAAYCWQQYVITLGYSFNGAGAALKLTSYDPVYVKCTPQADGSAIIDSTTPYVQALPTTDDGSIYIFLGIAASATTVELQMNHPVYYYKDGAVRRWFGPVA